MLTVNPYKIALHNFAKELLRSKYNKHSETIERLSYHFLTEKDISVISQLLVDSYEEGFLACMNAYKSELTRLGINIQITEKKH